jgi:hypothetical protein
VSAAELKGMDAVDWAFVVGAVAHYAWRRLDIRLVYLPK